MDLNKLVSEYGMNVSRMAHRMLSNSTMAEDAVQECWYEIIRSIDSFKGESELSTWIYTVAKRTIIRYATHERLVSHENIEHCISKGQIAYDNTDIDKETWIKEKCDDCITAFCHCLSNDARLVFLFRENLDLSYPQISKIMDMSEDNVRKIASRSFQKVKNYLTNNCSLLNPLGTCGCRIREQVRSINFDDKYKQLQQANRLLEFFKKFDKELPRKNYWEKYLSKAVTN